MTGLNIDHNLFAIIEKDGRSFVEISKVVRLLADGTYTWVVFDDGRKILTTKNLGYYEKILPHPENTLANKFFRVHHKHLINLSYMQKYCRKNKTIRLQTGDDIIIAQRRVKMFTSMLRDFSLF